MAYAMPHSHPVPRTIGALIVVVLGILLTTPAAAEDQVWLECNIQYRSPEIFMFDARDNNLSQYVTDLGVAALQEISTANEPDGTAGSKLEVTDKYIRFEIYSTPDDLVSTTVISRVDKSYRRDSGMHSGADRIEVHESGECRAIRPRKIGF
jgi:hypothetical protein